MATEIRVCFKNRLKNAYLTVATVDIDEAKRIARIWGETRERTRDADDLQTANLDADWAVRYRRRHQELAAAVLIA